MPDTPPPVALFPTRGTRRAADVNVRLGRLVARARRKLGLSQRGLDRMLAVAHGTTYAIEVGDHEPGFSTAVRFVGLLGLDFAAILHGERGLRGAEAANE